MRSHIQTNVVSVLQMHMFLFLCVCDIVVITLMAGINQCQACDRCSAVPVDTNKSKQLEKEASEKREKQPSGHCLHPEIFPGGRYSICFC